MRQEVYKIALQYSEMINKTLNPDDLYYFFMQVCKAEKIRPKDLKPHINDNWLIVGNKSKISIKPIHFNYGVRRSWIEKENAIDYEELILARQEQYFD